MKSMYCMSLFLFAMAHFAIGFQTKHHYHSHHQYGLSTLSQQQQQQQSRRSRTTHLKAVSYDVVASIGYGARVEKPLGVIFGENKEPYYGLVVDGISEGLNGAVAGLRVGDQLLAVNGQVVVGASFDSTMSLLQGSPKRLELILFRGPVSTLYTILSNQLGEDEDVRDEDEGEEAVIMDENYESPVKIEVKEQKPLTPGDFLKAFKKVGQMMMEEPKDKPKEPKKKTGFFGIGAESIQLDGDDAKGYK